MIFQFTFKHMESSDALAAYAEKKLGAIIRKFVTKPGHAHVTFTVEKADHLLHIKLTAGDGFSAELDDKGTDMYAVVDSSVDKLNRMLRKKKEKLKDHKNWKIAKVLEKVTDGLQKKDEDSIDASDILKLESRKRRPVLSAITIS